MLLPFAVDCPVNCPVIPLLFPVPPVSISAGCPGFTGFFAVSLQCPRPPLQGFTGASAVDCTPWLRHENLWRGFRGWLSCRRGPSRRQDRAGRLCDGSPGGRSAERPLFQRRSGVLQKAIDAKGLKGVNVATK
jgi:hypothetical protein